MNKQQREDLAKIHKRLDDVKTELDQLKGLIETEQEAEQEKFDNIPEGLQQGEKGQKIEEGASELQTAVDGLDNIINELDDVLTAVDNATQE